MVLENKILPVCFAILASFSLAGCSTPSPIFVPGLDDSTPRAKLIVSSRQLRGAVELRNARFRKVGKLTQTQIDLVNRTSSAVDLEYQIVWQDDQGFDAGGLKSWRHVSISAKGTEGLTSLGNVPKAFRVTLTVRLPEEFFEHETQETE